MSLSTVINYGILSGIAPSFPISGLKHYWALDETAGSTVYDTVGILHGTVNNATINETGKHLKAVLFNANNENINFGNVLDIQTDDAYSFSLWFNSMSFGDGCMLITKFNTSTNYGYEIWAAGTGRVYVLHGDAGGDYLGMGTPAVLSTGVWNHVVVTYTGSGLASGFEIYVGGIKQTHYSEWTGTVGAVTNNMNFYIGNRHTGGSLSANGVMDEVAMYDRAITQAEVTALYNSGNGLFY